MRSCVSIRKSVSTCVEDGRPVPDVHRGRGLFGAQQLTDDRRGHHAGRVADLWEESGRSSGTGSAPVTTER